MLKALEKKVSNLNNTLGGQEGGGGGEAGGNYFPQIWTQNLFKNLKEKKSASRRQVNYELYLLVTLNSLKSMVVENVRPS